MNKHIKLFESFFREEDSNIYEAQKIYNEDTFEHMYKDEPGLLEKQRAIIKTWIIDYVCPMWGFSFDDPKLQALAASAKIWLSKDSGAGWPKGKEMIYRNGDFEEVEFGGPLTNGAVVRGLYDIKEMFTPEPGRPVGPSHISRQEPLLTSMYALMYR